MRGARGPHLHAPFSALVIATVGIELRVSVCVWGVCFLCFIRMSDVASVSYGYCICCNGYICMLQVYLLNVSAISSGCCICCSGHSVCFKYFTCSDICCKCFILMFHMLKWLYTYVVSLCFNLFHLVSICYSKCCSPHALSRAARTQPTLPISVMRANANSWTCTQRAVSAQTAEHSLIKVHARI
jgi:hypothetical protein